MRLWLVLMVCALLAGADDRSLGEIQRFARDYPADAVRYGIEPDARLLAALQQWQVVLQSSPSDADRLAADVVAARIRNLSMDDAWALQRITVADPALWSDPIGQACVAWHRQHYLRRCAEIAGTEANPEAPYGEAWKLTNCIGERQRDLAIVRAVQLGFLHSELPQARAADALLTAQTQAAERALATAVAGTINTAAVDAYALGQTWNAWQTYQARTTEWGTKLADWRQPYGLAMEYFLREQLAVGVAEQRCLGEVKRWRCLVDEQRRRHFRESQLASFDEEFSALPELARLRSDVTISLEAISKIDQQWLRSELTGTEAARGTSRQQHEAELITLDTALRLYVVRARTAMRLAEHPAAGPQQVAALNQAMAANIAAIEHTAVITRNQAQAAADRAVLAAALAEATGSVVEADAQTERAAEVVNTLLDAEDP